MTSTQKMTAPASNEDAGMFGIVSGIDYIGDIIANENGCYAASCHDFGIASFITTPRACNTGGASHNTISTPPPSFHKLKDYLIPVYDRKSRDHIFISPHLPNKTIIDFLSFTSTYSPDCLLKYMSLLVPGLEMELQKGGKHGYKKFWILHVGGENVGIVCSEMSKKSFLIPTFLNGKILPKNQWEVASSFGRSFFQLTGAGTKHIKNWVIAYKLLKRMSARLSRIDFAMDFYHGEVTFEDAYHAAFAIPEVDIPSKYWKLGKIAGGEFRASTANKSRGLTSSVIDSSNSKGNCGRTLNIGAPKGSKKCCIYEKGFERYNKLLAMYDEEQKDIQNFIFNDPAKYGCPGNTLIKDWVRVEVRFGNCDRVLDLDMLIFRDKYFSGAYPFCSRVIGLGDGLKPALIMKKSEVSIEKLGYYAKQGYGGYVFALNKIGYSNDEIVAKIIGDDFSARLKKDAIAVDIAANYKQFIDAFIGPVYPNREWH